MSGIAIIIKGADFSQNNLGKVNFLENIPVKSISISGPSELSKQTAQYTISVLPDGTSQKEVLWSITSGSEYAKIDGNGNLTVIKTAVSASVTIKAVSLYNSSVYAVKTITLSNIEIPNINPTYIHGYYTTYFMRYPDDTDSKKYASFELIPIEQIERVVNVICEDGWQVRLIVKSNSSIIRDIGNVTTITDLLSEIQKLNQSAISFSLNVSHVGTSGPTSGSDITEDELQNMNNYIRFVFG